MIVREVSELIEYHKNFGHRFAEYDYLNVYRKALRGLARNDFNGLEGKRVLDLGCGQRFPFALQCSAEGPR
jgi:2-polyprenyl-3-methyl-5-hydroxy-6-metoxy-1,4-benzoquinol methylase